MKVKLFTIFLCFSTALSAEQMPLSAIDWLAQTRPSPTVPQTNTQETGARSSTGASVPEISVSPLETINVDSVGLLPPSTTGLPVSIWRNSRGRDVIQLMRAMPNSRTPAIQSVFYSLLLAEADAPQVDNDSGSFLAARIETLIKLGAVNPALALLERASPLPAPLVPTFFDVSLYDSSIPPSCDQVLSMGATYPDDATRIYCVARKGDWLTSTLILQTAEALGTLSDREASLLHAFLETADQDDLFASLPPPSRVSPLEFRLYEAIGAPLSANLLPRAFSNSDLNGDNGWKLQLAAAERLSETGAIGENQLLGIYTLHEPSASGGIWDRVAAFQKLDRALEIGDPDEVAQALDLAWSVFAETPLKYSFANIFAERLLDIPFAGSDRIYAARVAILSGYFERAAQNLDGQDSFLRAIAEGSFSEVIPQSDTERAIFDAFRAPRIPTAIDALVTQGKLGEVILNALIQFEKGAQGDPQDLLEALSTMRLVGLENTARRAAIAVYLAQDSR